MSAVCTKLIPKYVARYAGGKPPGNTVSAAIALSRYIIDHDMANRVFVILTPEMWAGFHKNASLDPMYEDPDMLIFDGFDPELGEGELPAQEVLVALMIEPTHSPHSTLQ